MEQLKNKLKLSCYHCGENCSGTSIHIEEKLFCCSGCKMVYEILNKNNLCTYYQLTEAPGITQKINVRANKFSFLEDPEVFTKLIQFTDGKQTRVTFYLPQMHCSSCIWLLENLHQVNSEILNSTVDFPKREITIVYNQKRCSLKLVAELLTAIGYEPHIHLNDLDGEKSMPSNRARIFKLGIAGFCFGNIMMLSFPEYFSSGTYYIDGLKELFGYLILMLALPVFFYCASEFYLAAWKGLKQKILNIDAPIVIAILVTFSRSVYEIVSGSGSGYLDSMSGIVFFMLAGRMFQDRVYNSISFERDYKSYFPIAVAVKKDEKEENISVSKLKVGDRIVIRNNELIPADSILFYGKASIDYSFVTGESLPQEKSIGEIIYAGGKQIGGAIEMEVVKEVSQSYLTQLWNNDAFSKTEAEDTSFIHQLSRKFTLVLFTVAALASVYWWVYDPSKILNAFTSILIVACPCSLLLSATFTNGNIIRIFSRNKLYVKNSTVIEELADADTIVFDKTGTITQNGSSSLKFEGMKLTAFEEQLVRSVAAQSAHPLSKAIYSHYSQHHLLPCSNFTELIGKGIEATILGMEVRMGSSKYILNKQKQSEAGAKIYVEINTNVLGCFSLNNGYRKGFEELVKSLKGKYQLALISGDNDAERAYLQRILGETAELKFQQSPENKLDFISNLQAQNRKVIMLGDGLNDAGALKRSNVGIAVNDSNNNFSPACDALMEGSEFGKLNQFIAYAKAGKKIIIGSFILSIVYNLVGISFAAQGTLSPMIAAILMPASSISIVLFTVGLSTLIAKKRGLL